MSGLIHTFGGNEVAEVLVKRLSADPKAFSRVSAFYCDYNKTLNTFEELCVSNGHFWKNQIKLYFDERIQRMETLLTVEQGKTYLRNLMTIKKRHVIRIIDDIIKVEKKVLRKKNYRLSFG